MRGCENAVVIFHRMWHELVDPCHVAIKSGMIDLADTDPETTVVIIAAVVDKKDSLAVRKIGHEEMSGKMTELYGAAVNETKH
jgi:hypothetical protein